MSPRPSIESAPVAVCVPARLSTLLEWHGRYAVNPSSLIALPTMTQMLTLPGFPGGLGFQRVGRVLIASGEPLAPVDAWAALAAALLEQARATGAVPCFAPVGAEYAAILDQLGLRMVRLGSTPYVHLQDWPPTGKAGAGVRAAVNRASRDDLVLSQVAEADLLEQGRDLRAWRGEVRDLAATWLRRRRARVAFQWIFQLQPLAFSANKRYFEARQAGRLVGLIAASSLPGRDGWYLEDVLRAEDAPASTSTALVAYALSAFKVAGVRLGTLGGVPLAQQRGWDDAEVTSLERLAYRLRPLLSRLYAFDGLETFKRRFGPAHWENEFLALPGNIGAVVAVTQAVTRLILLRSPEAEQADSA